MLDNLMEGNLLKNCLQQILVNENLDTQRLLIKKTASELNIDPLACASALLYLLQNGKNITVEEQKINVLAISQSHIKMVRYRLAVGNQHQINLETLKRVLVEESGVDKNNISNISIRDDYTLIDLPDEMPLDIFQHLKSVEINQHQLDIRRVKTRHNKKRGNNHYRRGRQSAADKSSGQIASN